MTDKKSDAYAMEDPTEKAARPKGSRKKLTAVVVAIVAAAVLVVAGVLVYQAVRPADISAYADREITLIGLEEEPVTITVGEIADMECVDLVADGTGLANSRQKTKAGEEPAHGPTLETLLAHFGATKDEFASMTCTGYNGYENTLTVEQLDQEVVCSISEGKDPLYRDYQPLYIILPDDGTDTWCYGVEVIEFVRVGAEGANAQVDAAKEGGEVDA